MSTPEELRQVAENTLYNLTADDSLKFRILQKASAQPEKSSGKTFFVIPVMCTVLTALLIAVFALNTVQPVPAPVPGEMNVFAAGNIDTDNNLFPNGFLPESVISIALKDHSLITDANQCASLASILLHESETSKNNSVSSADKLVISTSEDEQFIFAVSEPYLTGNDGRCWLCSRFFEEYEKMNGEENGN